MDDASLTLLRQAMRTTYLVCYDNDETTRPPNSALSAGAALFKLANSCTRVYLNSIVFALTGARPH
jgi:hypothetical protein